MGVGWIDNVYNNSDRSMWIRSIDSSHNGTLTSSNGNNHFALDDGKFHELKPHTHYKANWFGIPWYYQGKHFKSYSADKTINFYTSQIGNQNYIIFLNETNGQELLRQKAPTGSDFHCNLRFENVGTEIDIVNNNPFSGENAGLEIYNQYKEWVKDAASVAASAVSAFV